MTVHRPKFRVLRSAAGWYVGTLTEEGFPNSRDSGYFRTEEEAKSQLNLMLRAGLQPRVELGKRFN